MNLTTGGRHRTLLQLEAANILFIKPSALGDVVQALPVISALRQRFPAAKLTWLVGSAYRDVLLGHPALDEVISFDRARYRGREFSPLGTLEFLKFLRRLRRRRFDLTLDLQGLFRSGMMALATGATVRVGLAGSRELAHLAYTHVVPVPVMDVSAVDRYWHVAEAFGVGHLPKDFTVMIPEDQRRWVDDQLEGRPRPYLAVNPGAGWVTKRWPTQHFAEVAQRFVDTRGGTVLLTGATGDRPLTAAVAAVMTAPSVDLAGRTSLKQLAAVLGTVDAVVSGDTGPTHLSAALGTPTVAIFTCTSPARARPYGSAHAVVEARVACAGSRQRECDRLECFDDVSVDRVWEALQKTLAAATDR